MSLNSVAFVVQFWLNMPGHFIHEIRRCARLPFVPVPGMMMRIGPGRCYQINEVLITGRDSAMITITIKVPEDQEAFEEVVAVLENWSGP